MIAWNWPSGSGEVINNFHKVTIMSPYKKGKVLHFKETESFLPPQGYPVPRLVEIWSVPQSKIELSALVSKCMVTR